MSTEIHLKVIFQRFSFNTNTQQFFIFLSRDSSFSFSYPGDCNSHFVGFFVNSINLKRAIRNTLPRSIHHILFIILIKKSTLRKFENNAAFLLAIKLKDLNISLQFYRNG